MERYSRAAIMLHWLIAILFLAATGLALFRETFGPWHVEMISAHKGAGLAILPLAALALAMRLRSPAPPLAVGRIWERRLVRGVHALLRALLLFVPVAGWIFVSLAPDGRPLDYRGLDTVPELPLGDDDALSLAWHEAHEIAGFALVFLFALHIAGFLSHRLRRDAVLPRMLTGAARMDILARLALLLALVWTVGLAFDVFGLRPFG